MRRNSISDPLCRFSQLVCTYDLAGQGGQCRKPWPVPQMVTEASHGQRDTGVEHGYLDTSPNDLREELPNSQDCALNFIPLPQVIPKGPL